MKKEKFPFNTTGNNVPDYVMKAFAVTLKRLRTEKELTQHDLEDRSGVSLRMISDLERGLKQPSLATLMKLAKGLDISFMVLMEEFVKDMDRNS